MVLRFQTSPLVTSDIFTRDLVEYSAFGNVGWNNTLLDIRIKVKCTILNFRNFLKTALAVVTCVHILFLSRLQL